MSRIVLSHALRPNSINLIDKSISLGYVLVAAVTIDGSVVGFVRLAFTRKCKKHWLHEIAVSPPQYSLRVSDHSL